MTVRAKFQVSKATHHLGGSVEVLMTAATSGEENKEWAKWTPNGQINMFIAEGPAAEALGRVGTNFYVDFYEVTE